MQIRAADRRRSGRGDGVWPITTLTDSDGYYLFTALPPGEYTVSVIDANFGAGQPLEYWNQTPSYDPDGDSNLSSTVTVGAADEIRDRDWGFAPDGNGTIGDFIFRDPNGDGNPSDGVGLGGVTVYLYEDTDGNGVIDPGVDQLITTTTTNGSGIYSFPGLPEGFDYLVYVDPFDPAVQAGMPDDSYTPSTNNPISVLNLAGTNNTADIGFRDVPPSSIGDQVCTDVNSDGLCTGADTPLGNILITLWNDVDGNGALDPAIDTVVTTTTSDPTTGAYIFDGLPPGDYLVDVDNDDADVPPGYAPSADEIAVNLPIPAPGASTGTDVTTADFPFIPLIAKTVNKATADAGETLTYEVIVRNPSSSLLTDAVVTDAVPAGSTYVGGSANAGGSESGGVVTWNLGSNDGAVPGVYDGYDYFKIDVDATQDTYLDQDSDDKNFGASTLLIVDPQSGKATRPILQFDTSSIPTNAEVTFAYLETYQTAVGNEAGDIRLEAYALTQDWNEGALNGGTGAANWTNRTTANTWSTPGGTVSGTLAGAVAVNTSVGPTEFEIVMTDLVQDWVSTPAVNNGILLRAQNENAGNDKQAHTFSSRTGSNPPELAINYRVPNGPIRSTLLAAKGTLVPDTGSIEITMALSTQADINNVTPSALTVVGGNGANAIACTAPSPSGPFTVVAGTPSIVTYTCTADAGTDVGNVRFKANATTSDGYTFKEATSNSVIVAPKLTFDVVVDNPLSQSIIVNKAEIADASGNLPPTTSNEVETVVGSLIGDTVYYDFNGNGVQDAGELGIPNVTVYLKDSGGAVIDTKVTDANGYYIFDVMEDTGTFTVEVDQGTLPNNVIQTDDPDSACPSAGCDGSTTASIPAVGTMFDTADFGYQPETKSVDKADAAPGDTLKYTLSPIYPGSGLLSNVQVKDSIPAGTTYVSDSDTPEATVNPSDTPAATEIVWNLGSNTPAVNGNTPVTDGSVGSFGTTNQQVDTVRNADSNDRLPAVTVDAAGVLHAVFNNNGARTYYIKSTDNGATWSAAVQLPQFNSEDKDRSADIAVDGGGNIHVVVSNEDKNVFYARSTDGGASFTNQGQIDSNTGIDSNDLLPRIVADGNDKLHVVFNHNGERTYYNSSSNGGTSWAGASILPQFNGEDKDTSADIAVDGGATIHVVVSNEDKNVFYARSTDGGASFTNQGQIDSNTVIDSNDRLPRIVADGNGKLHVVFNHNGERTYYNSSSNGGTSWAGASIVDQVNGESKDTSADIAVDACGALHVTIGNDGKNVFYTNSFDNAANWSVAEEVDTSIGDSSDKLPVIAVTSNTVNILFDNNSKNIYHNSAVLTLCAPATETRMAASPTLVVDGDTVTIYMAVTATEAVNNITPSTPTVVNATGGATCTSITNADVGPKNIAANGTALFSWTCTVDDGTDVGSMAFSANALGTDVRSGQPLAFASATSNSVLVSPPLTFEVTVNDPASVSPVTNQATLQDANILTTPVPTNKVETDIELVVADIGNYVWLDENGDGVQDAGEAGIANVIVTLTPPAGVDLGNGDGVAHHHPDRRRRRLHLHRCAGQCRVHGLHRGAERHEPDL